ncbi:MAG: hypothetical protein JSS79_10070 [Bacteroidetes bacterium]|nr:hypothetical protein [Bacteroidota bacterium]
MVIRRILFSAAFGLLFVCGFAQEDYARIFGRDYQKAVAFFESEKWMNDVIESHHLIPHEVKAIVFPELIRYSALKDKFETFALESLYAQYGKTYANFSIGEFQIKPSFAENIEKDFLILVRENSFAIHPSDTIQNAANRAARVARLKNKKAMLNYILMFFKVMDKKYPSWKNEADKIKFFACAYNSDYQKSEKEILLYMPKRFFTASLVSSSKYCYSDISHYYFLHQ